ncbi:uncharacterized protein LOC123556729 [Mercenaria mercenaria]|uniref:uncharacterized protein LOC123556729 n=1 Tax=Mercenaria mercenaria TaxID=6596 RepID=UPI00234F4AAA|nr:uncharacterized protein LOC123556729 [Mercenaria mercenaria]
MADWSTYGFRLQCSGAQQAGSQGICSQYDGRKIAWEHHGSQHGPSQQQQYTVDKPGSRVRENRESPILGSQSSATEQYMDVDDPLNKDREMPTLKNTTELLANLEGLQSLAELSKRELTSIKQSLSTRIPDENAILKKELENLRKENQGLQKRGQEMPTNTRDREKIKNLEQEIKTVKEALDKYKDAFQDISQKHKEELAKTQRLHQTLTEYEMNRDKMENECESLKEQLSNVQKLYEKIKEEKKKSEADLSESRTRLSRLMGNKLANNNPDIADLSDKNRPTKLAEKNQELYDNEWTNAFEVIHEHFQNEDKTIQTLVQMLQDIKTQCDTFTKEQEQKLSEAVKLKRTRENLPEHMVKQLKDFRRFTAEVSLPEVKERCWKAVAYMYSSRVFKDDDVQRFFQGCVELCWLMNLQDPPLAFGETPKRNDAFDGNTYKFYTETGPFVDYIVWPALLLEKDGSLLSKGIAQAHRRQQTEFCKMKNAETPRSNAPMSGSPKRLQTAPSGQTNDRNIEETGIQPENQYHDQEERFLNRQGQNFPKQTYEKSLIGGQNLSTNNAKNFSRTTTERASSSVAERINKNLGGSQREGLVERQLPVRPDEGSWRRFKDLLRLYNIDSPEVHLGVGDKYNICKEYYTYVFGGKTGTAV